MVPVIAVALVPPPAGVVATVSVSVSQLVPPHPPPSAAPVTMAVLSEVACSVTQPVKRQHPSDAVLHGPCHLVRALPCVGNAGAGAGATPAQEVTTNSAADHEHEHGRGGLHCVAC